MYQCGSSATPAVAPGWSVYAADTSSTAVLSNNCGAGGALGLYVFGNGTPGVLTTGASASVGLAVNVDGAPDVTIAGNKRRAGRLAEHRQRCVAGI